MVNIITNISNFLNKKVTIEEIKKKEIEISFLRSFSLINGNVVSPISKISKLPVQKKGVENNIKAELEVKRKRKASSNPRKKNEEKPIVIEQAIIPVVNIKKDDTILSKENISQINNEEINNEISNTDDSDEAQNMINELIGDENESDNSSDSNALIEMLKVE
jgi:hypothetical protein